MSSSARITHRNSFDLIRHIAALSVLFCHHYAISGFREPSVGGLFSVGGLAVVVFFSISGYLVAKSFGRCTDFLDFIGRRSRRIFPGYVACCFLMIYLLGFAYSDLTIAQFSSKAAYFDMLVSYSVFVYPTIPKVFDGYHLNMAVNGSLWTLSVEFMCYLLLGAVLSLSKSFKPVLLTIALLVAAYLWIVATQSTQTVWYVPGHLVTSFAASFFVGSLLGMTEVSWKAKNARLWLGLSACTLLYVTNGKPEAMIFAHLLIPIITIFIGTSFSERVVAGKYDISYGIYIYAFPVQQIIVNATPLGFWTSMVASFVVTIALATASWRLIEKPAIGLGKKQAPSSAPAAGA